MPRLPAALEQLHTAIVATLPEAETTALLKPHPRLKPAELIGIYQEGYHLRLQAAVRADYPALLHFLGAVAEPLIAAFVRQTPSQTYNLDRYSIGFANYLAQHATPAAATLAALEAAMTEAFMFQDAPALSASALVGMDEAVLGASRIMLQQSVRLLHVGYDVDSYFSAFKTGAAPTEIATRESWLLLYRQNRDVRRASISAGEYVLLQAIQSNADFNAALTSAMATTGGETAILPHIGGWLTGWFTRGMVAAIDKSKD